MSSVLSDHPPNKYVLYTGPIWFNIYNSLYKIDLYGFFLTGRRRSFTILLRHMDFGHISCLILSVIFFPLMNRTGTGEQEIAGNCMITITANCAMTKIQTVQWPMTMVAIDISGVTLPTTGYHLTSPCRQQSCALLRSITIYIVIFPQTYCTSYHNRPNIILEAVFFPF